MAITAIQATNSLQGIFPVFLFGLIGIIGPTIMMFSSLDSMTDQFKANYVDNTEEEFEFIVVGSGSSGAVVASRLSEHSKTLLLESGGEPYIATNVPASAFLLLNRKGLDWNYLTVPQKKACFAMTKNRCAMPRGKVLGGSSILNFMAYARGHPYDYDQWANLTGDKTWNYENVLPFFLKSENYIYSGKWDDKMKKYHATGGPLDIGTPHYTGMADYFVQAGKELGYPTIDYNAPFDEGFSPFVYNQRKGLRLGTYQAFLRPIMNTRPNLSIYKFAHVNKILFDNDRAYAVEYIRHGHKKIAKASKDIILSAGAINSPKILMLSGIGPKEHLQSLNIKVKRDLPGVGQNLQDHVSTFVGPFLLNKTVSFNMDRDVTARSMTEFLLDGRGPLTSTAVQATGFLSSQRAKDEGWGNKWADLQWVLLGTSVYNRYGSDSEFSFNVRKGLLQKYYKPGKGKDSFQIITILSRPASRGQVKLASANPSVNALFDPNYFDKYEDVKVMVESVRRSVEFVENTNSFKQLGAHLMPGKFPTCESFKFKSDKYYECFIRSLSLTMYHPTCTCKMGKADDPMAVVDSKLKVFGVKGLRVIDASIMPRITSANTNAPSIMIGELGAELIKKEYKK